MICDIKTSAEAWNHGIESFEKAILLNGDATKALRYALKEIAKKYPDMDFSPDSFTAPLIEKLKENKIVGENYTFKGSKANEVDKIVNKFKDLNNEQARELSKKIFEKSFKNGMVNKQEVQNAYAQVKGFPSITPEFTKLIDQVATDRQQYEAVDKRIKEILGRIQTLKKEGAYTPENEKSFSDQLTELKKEKIKALKTYVNSDIKFGEMLSDKRHWVYQFGDIMKMNLMSPVSLLKNTTGMLGDAVFRNLSNLVASPISFTVLAARKAMGKTKGNITSPSLLSRTAGTFKGDALAKAGIFAKTGSEPVYSDKIRRPNYIDGVRNIRKIMDGEPKFINALAAFFKVSPTLITRGLGSPDFLFQEMAETAELNRIGNEKGYTGAELKAFLLAPDEESAAIAKEHGRKVTYKQELPFSLEKVFQSIDFVKAGDAMIEKGMAPWQARLLTGVGHVVKNIIMPFTTTPINILRSANKIVLPEYTLIKGLMEAKKLEGDEKTNKIISSISDATVGFHIRMIALNLIAQGLISAGYDDEEDKVIEVVEKKTGGPNKVNVNAFMRGLTFQDIKEKKGDKYVDINALGTLGIALGAYAHAYNKYGQKDLQKEIDYLKDGNYFSIPAKAGLAQITSAMDFTFFSGWNELNRGLKDESGYALNKYAMNSFMTMLGGILPASHQILSKSETESRPRSYDKNLTFGQNVYNQMGYRFMFATPDKTFKVLTENGEKTERVKEHYLFDNYWGRVLAAVDPFKSKGVENMSTPTGRLYNEMRNVEKKERDKIVPGYVSDKVKIKGNDIQLNKEQYAYFQSQASLHRMFLATPFIMSADFHNMSYEEKCDELQNLYKEGRESALAEVAQKYFPKLEKKEKTDEEVDQEDIAKERKQAVKEQVEELKPKEEE